MILRARQARLPAGLMTDVAIDLAGDGEIRDVRPGIASDPPSLDGLLIPGLINAHTHIELSHLAGLVPGGNGLVHWVRNLMAVRTPSNEAADQGARALARAGVIAALDVSNEGDTGPALRRAGLVGTVAHERIGFSPERLPVTLSSLRTTQVDGVVTRPSPHALYSTHPELVRAASAVGKVPATIHIGEDPAERRFLHDGGGPLADLLDELGVDWRWWHPPGTSPVATLHALGALRPDVLLVHAVDTDDADLELILSSGARVCLCPRSNLHVSGRLAPADRYARSHIPLAIGTDGLVSSPDLDPLGEVAELVRRFPDVDPLVWLDAATQGGAAALGRRDLGRIEIGARPGLVLLNGVRDIVDLKSAPERQVWSPA